MPEGDRLDILTTLVQADEARHVPITAPDPVDAINIGGGDTVTVVFTDEQTSECPGDRGAPPVGA